MLEFHILYNDLPRIMETVRKFGGKEPELWVAALYHLAGCAELHTEEIEEVRRL